SNVLDQTSEFVRGPQNVYKDTPAPRSARPTRIRLVLSALLIGSLSAAWAQAQICPGSPTSTQSPQFPDYTYGIANTGVWAGDQYVYALSYYGFIRAGIANPEFPGPAQLAQIGYDRAVQGGGGGVIVVDCDCHGGGAGMAVAESPTGALRLVSDWQPYFENAQAFTEIQAAQGVGATFKFGQQVNTNPTAFATPMAAIYLPSGKFFGYIPQETGGV